MIHHCFFLINPPSKKKKKKKTSFFCYFPLFLLYNSIILSHFSHKIINHQFFTSLCLWKINILIPFFFQKLSKHHGSIAFFLTPKSSRRDLVKKKRLFLENDVFFLILKDYMNSLIRYEGWGKERLYSEVVKEFVKIMREKECVIYENLQ